MAFQVQGIDHVALAVSDQAASEDWYREVLGLEREYASEWGDTPVMVMAEGSGLALFKSSRGDSPGALRHIAFRVDRENFEAARTDLRRREIEFEFRDHGVSHSIYFEGPDGIELELTTYEV